MLLLDLVIGFLWQAWLYSWSRAVCQSCLQRIGQPYFYRFSLFDFNIGFEDFIIQNGAFNIIYVLVFGLIFALVFLIRALVFINADANALCNCWELSVCKRITIDQKSTDCEPFQLLQ